MKLPNKKDIRLSIVNQKKIYAFLSKTIYNELIEYGVEEEYTFPFLLYLHWTVIKKYTDVSRNTIIYNTEKILHKLQNTIEAEKEIYNQELTDFIETLFADNSEILISIYQDVCETDSPPIWLQEWQNLCEFCYTTKSQRLICLSLLKIVNECLNMPHHKTNISLNILLKIEKNKQDMMCPDRQVGYILGNYG
ncbi:hypothetical protein [Pedobacter heparinus]|uniref:Uncharacterized protein n=1 Tax=Pedobacter heparinus (strain ATCC 13125 / DSM 2366 / CIP 104194 / JCM 7457 / NBRC 12017 / NCIMB 9290 / NRRL B-14731 / HIM 762-3) TaxID=485917 RepID=C6Y0L1_PEDHD|nr:hypothetical protein [Pedobacter heparinus]ACU02772.1 hypothetical protein Phep_0548 [Pedobacter heparinus DSM 2366]